MQVEAKIEDILEVVQDGQMKEYEFELTIKKVDDSRFEEICDLLFESGCDDSTILIKKDELNLIFCREAASFKEALVTAKKNVEDALEKL